MYTYERGTTIYSGNATTWTGKIALPYPSDYGYATDLEKCNKTLSNYNDSNCTANNWMKTIFETYNYHWLLTSNSDRSGSVTTVSSTGTISNNLYDATTKLATRPVLYLDSKLIIQKGTGSSTEPYQLSLS